MQRFAMSELLERRRRAGGPWMEFLRVPAMSLGIYVLRPGEEDLQTPHAEDEIYHVIEGEARFRCDDDDRPVRAGDVLFVEARARHRFHAVTRELTLLVFFAPAENAEAASALR
jgi:mannose-6-phosphate isomerase-like protein (cupin superfamily)